MPEGEAGRVALITGAAQRIGAAIARELHRAGCRVLIHYRHSADRAAELERELNARRPGSCCRLQADLCLPGAPRELAERVQQLAPRLDLLVNNASAFYATPIGSATEAQWNELFDSNLKAAFFLSQSLAPALAQTRGAIVNIVDVHAAIPLPQHAVYAMAKAGLAMMTRSLAAELGPAIRVNGVAPGAILWPEQPNAVLSAAHADALLAQTALKRMGTPEDIAGAVRYLGLEAGYVTGQVLAVDGGRSLY
jgi:pteridine reductase